MRLGRAEAQLVFALHKIVQERLEQHEVRERGKPVPRKPDARIEWVETPALKKHVWMSLSYVYSILDLLEAHRLIKREASYGRTKRCRLTAKGKLWVAKSGAAEN